jgi:hypothetical protein
MRLNANQISGTGEGGANKTPSIATTMLYFFERVSDKAVSPKTVAYGRVVK